MITIPIFNYECSECGHMWESIEVWPSHAPTECPRCKSPHIKKVIGVPIVRMDPNCIKSVPDPVPPLEELRGKGSEGYKDKPFVEPDITKGWEYKKDKNGNKIWNEKRRIHIDMGRKK